MKPQHLVPVFIVALSLPGMAFAGAATQKGGCSCSSGKSHFQKSHYQKHSSKSSHSGCGCAQKGKGHTVVQKSKGISQKSSGCAHKSHGSCGSCCLEVIPAILNGVDHIVTSGLEHVAAVFACNSCGSKSKSGGSKGCGCSSKGTSPKVDLPIAPNPFEDDELQAPPAPSTEASHRIERRPTHRHVIRTTSVVPVVRSEPRTLSISVAQPLTRRAPTKAAKVVTPAHRASLPDSKLNNPAAVRTVSAKQAVSLVPHNPLRAN